jgi:hypothetical protein
MNEKNRNIVRANAFGTALDVALGSSDDDFHYQAEHATLAHNAFQSDLRLGIKLIFHESGCEVQWAHGKDSSEETRLDGYLSIDGNGTVAFPFWTTDDDGDQRVPMYLEIGGNRVRVFAYEGAPPDDERDRWTIFDSEQYESLAETVKDALEGDSNDAEHDALAMVADALGVEYTPFDDLQED